MSMNRLFNASNAFQGGRKRVLCICSAGLLRSPTAAWILSNEPFGFNTRAAGINEDFALVPVDNVLLHWADELVVMTEDQQEEIKQAESAQGKPIHLLDVPDNYGFRNPALVEIMTEKLTKIFIITEKNNNDE